MANMKIIIDDSTLDKNKKIIIYEVRTTTTTITHYMFKYFNTCDYKHKW